MAAVSWPAALGDPMTADKTRDDNVIRTRMDAGPTKRRRRYTARADTLNLSYRFDAAQLATFNTFHDTTLADGLIVYDLTDPIDGGTIDVALAAPPRTRAQGGGTVFDVSLQLEVQP